MAIFRPVVRHLSVPMSDDEFMAKSNELIDLEVTMQRMVEQIENAKAKLSLIKSTYKEGISQCKDNIDTTILELKRRSVFRDTKCLVIMDEDRKCSYVRRLDTMAIIPNSIRELTEDDLVHQEELFGTDLPEGITHDELLITNEEFEEETRRAEEETEDSAERPEEGGHDTAKPVSEDDPGAECDPAGCRDSECRGGPSLEDHEPEEAPETA